MLPNENGRLPAGLKAKVLLALLVLPLLLAGCDVGEAEIDFAIDLAFDWAIAKNLVTVSDCPPPYNSDDCSFGINAKEIARWKAGQNRVLGAGMDLFGVDRVDPEVGAALDAGEVVYNQEKADSLSDAGLEEGNLEKIDQAIELRPEDWSYQDKKAAVLLSQGDAEAAGEAFENADALVAERIKAGGSCLALQMNKLRNREQALYQQSQLHPENDQIRNELGNTQSQIWDLQNNPANSVCK